MDEKIEAMCVCGWTVIFGVIDGTLLHVRGTHAEHETVYASNGCARLALGMVIAQAMTRDLQLRAFFHLEAR